MKQNILTALENDGLIIGDGAMGTELQAKGLPAGTMPELWNDENAEAVLSIHRAYLDAGAQILTANTFGGNRLRMQEAGLAERATELTRLGASLASRAAGGRAWVAGSVGPTGGIMEPFGTLSVEEAEDIFGEQVTALAEGGADVILVETQHDIEEACAAIRAAKAKTNLPVLCTFAFNPKGRTMMGLKPDVAARRAEEAGAEFIVTTEKDSVRIPESAAWPVDLAVVGLEIEFEADGAGAVAFDDFLAVQLKSIVGR